MSEIMVGREEQTPVSYETRAEREERLEQLLGPRKKCTPAVREEQVVKTEEVLQAYHSYTPSKEDIYLPQEPFKEEEPHFVLIERIGSGGFGEVWKAQYYTGDIVAVKYCKEGIDKELIAAQLDHDNITRILGHGQDEKGQYVVREYVAGRNLKELLEQESVSQDCKTVIACSVVRAVQYLHRKGIVHGDIKLENILVPDDWENERVKVTDFGLARGVQTGCEQSMHTTTIQGSLRYLAPEMLYQNVRSTKESDAYALGKVVLEMFTGRQQHYPSDEALKCIVGPITLESDGLMTDLELCLYPDVKKRTTIDALVWSSEEFMLEDLSAEIQKCREKEFLKQVSGGEEEKFMKRVKEESYCGIRGLGKLVLNSVLPFSFMWHMLSAQEHSKAAKEIINLTEKNYCKIGLNSAIMSSLAMLNDLVLSRGAAEIITGTPENVWLLPCVFAAKGILFYGSDLYKRSKIQEAYTLFKLKKITNVTLENIRENK